ncbi:MAG: hypothetical protein QOI82_3518 [Actinomycetota bacterium]|jgi:hypothetical protein|nr:hypothetical protein [Actinomycetota bacterium]
MGVKLRAPALDGKPPQAVPLSAGGDQEGTSANWVSTTTLSLFALTAAIRWPTAALFAAPVAMLVHAHGYHRQLSRKGGGGRRSAEARRELRRWLNRAIVGATSLLLLNVAGLVLGSPMETASWALTGGGFFWWAVQLASFHDSRMRARLPGFLVDGKLALDVMHQLKLERCFARNATRVRTPPPGLIVLSSALILAVISATTSPAVAELAAGSRFGLAWHLATGDGGSGNGARGSEGESSRGGSDGSVLNARVVATPTASTVSACAVDETRRLVGRGVPAQVGRALFRAWFHIGGAVIGCPAGPPVRTASMWAVPLTGGQDSVADLVFGDGQATVVFADFYSLLNPILPALQSVDARLRWGLGTMQLVRLHTGACEIVERYQSDPPSLMPASVTALILDLAATTGAAPWLTSTPQVPSGLAYNFTLAGVKPGGGIRAIDTVTIIYRGGIARFDRTGAVARDNDPCPSSADRLPVVAGALERAVQRS